MEIIIEILVAVIALIHCYIFVFEFFFWEQRGPKIFSYFPLDLFPKTKTLAKNMGIYNSFLAAGLLWSFNIQFNYFQVQLRVFLLCCVVLAGVVGALTAERKIFFVQALPAILCLIVLYVCYFT